MPVESANYISQLNPASPTDASLKSEGDNEFRQIKTVLQTQFPNLATTPVTVTSNQLNDVTNKALRAGDTYTGTHNFTGATINVATASATDNDTSAASTAMVQAAILASSGITAVLPAQAGNAGKYLTTDATSASWGAVPIAGMTLVATLTPTAAANLDFLTTFSSTYDDYLIIGDGITVAADDFPRIRVAVAGTADSGSNYYEGLSFAGTAVTATSTSLQVTPTVTSAGKGAGFEILVANANAATGLKMIEVKGISQSAATPAFTSRHTISGYTATNAITGFRLFLNGGSNFGATGKIYVYGYSKS